MQAGSRLIRYGLAFTVRREGISATGIICFGEAIRS